MGSWRVQQPANIFQGVGNALQEALALAKNHGNRRRRGLQDATVNEGGGSSGGKLAIELAVIEELRDKRPGVCWRRSGARRPWHREAERQFRTAAALAASLMSRKKGSWCKKSRLDGNHGKENSRRALPEEIGQPDQNILRETAR